MRRWCMRHFGVALSAPVILTPQSGPQVTVIGKQRERLERITNSMKSWSESGETPTPERLSHVIFELCCLGKHRLADSYITHWESLQGKKLLDSPLTQIYITRMIACREKEDIMRWWQKAVVSAGQPVDEECWNLVKAFIAARELKLARTTLETFLNIGLVIRNDCWLVFHLMCGDHRTAYEFISGTKPDDIMTLKMAAVLSGDYEFLLEHCGCWGNVTIDLLGSIGDTEAAAWFFKAYCLQNRAALDDCFVEHTFIIPPDTCEFAVASSMGVPCSLAEQTEALDFASRVAAIRVSRVPMLVLFALVGHRSLHCYIEDYIESVVMEKFSLPARAVAFQTARRFLSKSLALRMGREFETLSPGATSAFAIDCALKGWHRELQAISALSNSQPFYRGLHEYFFQEALSSPYEHDLPNTREAEAAVQDMCVHVFRVTSHFPNYPNWFERKLNTLLDHPTLKSCAARLLSRRECLEGEDARHQYDPKTVSASNNMEWPLNGQGEDLPPFPWHETRQRQRWVWAPWGKPVSLEVVQ